MYIKRFSWSHETCQLIFHDMYVYKTFMEKSDIAFIGFSKGSVIHKKGKKKKNLFQSTFLNLSSEK